MDLRDSIDADPGLPPASDERAAAVAALQGLFAATPKPVSVVVKRRRLLAKSEPLTDEGEAATPSDTAGTSSVHKAARVFVLRSGEQQPEHATRPAPAAQPVRATPVRRRRLEVRRPSAVVRLLNSGPVRGNEAQAWQPPTDGPMKEFWALSVESRDYVRLTQALDDLRRAVDQAAAARQVLADLSL